MYIENTVSETRPPLALLEQIKDKKFIVSVQIDPPYTNDTQAFFEMIGELKKTGVSVIDVNSSRRISHDSIQLSAALKNFGLETIPHVTTRDSSINGLVNQIFGAYSQNKVENYLVITGDPYEAEQAIIPSRGVFQTDSIGALRAFNTHLRSNPKLLLPLTFAAAVNQNESNRLIEADRIQEKLNAGADFFMSQPVFSTKQAEKLFEFYRIYSDKPLLVGVWPLINAKTINAIWNGNIMGVLLPKTLYRHVCELLSDDQKLYLWGIEYAKKLISFIRQSTDVACGVYVVAPSRNPLLILDLLKETLS